MTHYDVLGVSPTASQDEIKAAYRNMLKAFHPDYYTGDKAFAERQTSKIVDAYNVLRDEQRRKDYDFLLNARDQGNAGREYRGENTSDQSKENQQSDASADGPQPNDKGKSSRGSSRKNKLKWFCGIVIAFLGALLTFWVHTNFFLPDSPTVIDLSPADASGNGAKYRVTATAYELNNTGIGEDWEHHFAINRNPIGVDGIVVYLEPGSRLTLSAACIERDRIPDMGFDENPITILEKNLDSDFSSRLEVTIFEDGKKALNTPFAEFTIQFDFTKL
ncbi:J domain-containing protein [Gemmiger sp. An194]|uniref:J domain-containing protein n=1 Tax=Gemmiger sp. An194 TaxID=1965582 RepID=UPI000B36CBAB|nr:J domain-containing protein [Gemmiger sp. An194]OUP23287.1 hypothetical protein B5F28_12335 [Gemmiger sp. An194]